MTEAQSNLVLQAFEEAARAIGRSPAHRGNIPAKSGTIVHRAEEQGVLLEICLGAQGRVCAARFLGATESALAGILELFCQAIEGLPLPEASDHGAIHALERLRRLQPTHGVAGILTSKSAGAAFSLCNRLIRRIQRKREAAAGERATVNFYNPPLSSSWRRQSAEERLSALEPVVAAFCSRERLDTSDFHLAEIEKMQRVIVGFGPRVEHERKPALLRAFEFDIQRATGDRLEVYMQEMKDHNAIRRL